MVVVWQNVGLAIIGPEFDSQEHVSTSEFSLAHTVGASTGVVPRKQSRERLVHVESPCFLIDVK